MNRKRDVQRRANATKIKHRVAYTCSEDDKPPTLHKLQSIFSWPSSSLIAQNLLVVDLTVLAILFGRVSNFIGPLLIDVIW
jgi:hypothetical protein